MHDLLCNFVIMVLGLLPSVLYMSYYVYGGVLSL